MHYLPHSAPLKLLAVSLVSAGKPNIAILQRQSGVWLKTISESRGTCISQSAFGNATAITVLLISSASVFSWKKASPKYVCKNMSLCPLYKALEMDTHVILLHRSVCSFPPHLMTFLGSHRQRLCAFLTEWPLAHTKGSPRPSPPSSHHQCHIFLSLPCSDRAITDSLSCCSNWMGGCRNRVMGCSGPIQTFSRNRAELGASSHFRVVETGSFRAERFHKQSSNHSPRSPSSPWHL